MKSLLLTLSLLLVVPGIARAHLGSTKRVHVVLAPYGADVAIDLDPADVGWELSLEDPDAVTFAEIAARESAVHAWMGGALRLETDHGACTASPVGALEQVSSDISRPGWAVRVRMSYDCPAPASGLRLVDDAVFPGDPQHESLVELEGTVSLLRPGRQSLALGDAPSIGAVAQTFLEEGAIHFATGWDHVLFVLSLLLGAGTTIAARGARIAGKEIAIVVTSFTVGHSLSLAAAAFDLVRVPSSIVEPAIAASIVVVAAWNVLRPTARGALPGVGLAFGFVHGLGFSTLLSELLPANGRVLPLLAFNVGLELAQLAVVALALGPLAWAAKQTWNTRVVVQGGSAVTGAIGLFWLVTRIAS